MLEELQYLKDHMPNKTTHVERSSSNVNDQILPSTSSGRTENGHSIPLDTSTNYQATVSDSESEEEVESNIGGGSWSILKRGKENEKDKPKVSGHSIPLNSSNNNDATKSESETEERDDRSDKGSWSGSLSNLLERNYQSTKSQRKRKNADITDYFPPTPKNAKKHS